MYPKKWRLKTLGYFCCLFFPQVLEKGSLSLKKLVIMWKYMKYWFQNGVVYISILSHSEVRRILVKSFKIRKMARSIKVNGWYEKSNLLRDFSNYLFFNHYEPQDTFACKIVKLYEVNTRCLFETRPFFTRPNLHRYMPWRLYKGYIVCARLLSNNSSLPAIQEFNGNIAVISKEIICFSLSATN